MTADRSAADLLAGDAWAETLGITVDSLTDERVLVRMELDGRHMNFLDGAHGGALFSLAEAAMGVAARKNGDGQVQVVDAHLALTAGGTEGDVFVAEATPVNVGRTLGVYRVVVTRTDGRTVGEFTGTVSFR